MAGMNAIDPLSAPTSPIAAAFEVRRAAAGGPPPTPLVFASPHSGRVYPEDMMSAAVLDAVSIRRSEDAFLGRRRGPVPCPERVGQRIRGARPDLRDRDGVLGCRVNQCEPHRSRLATRDP